MAFGRVWQHVKHSYGVWQPFALNSENFEKAPKIEKCTHFFEMFGFGTRRVEEMFFSSQNARGFRVCRKDCRTAAVR